jgi:hypothetical protein
VRLNCPAHLVFCRSESDDFSVSQLPIFFFSHEEPRMHVHVISPDGEAKFWLEPKIELAVNKGLSTTELNELKRL